MQVLRPLCCAPLNARKGLSSALTSHLSLAESESSSSKPTCLRKLPAGIWSPIQGSSRQGPREEGLKFKLAEECHQAWEVIISDQPPIRASSGSRVITVASAAQKKILSAPAAAKCVSWQCHHRQYCRRLGNTPPVAVAVKACCNRLQLT